MMDFAPFVNIPTFGLCHSPANPEVIALTAAALGVPTPAPCVPVVVTPWISPSNVLIDGMPVLTEGAGLRVSMGRNHRIDRPLTGVECGSGIADPLRQRASSR